MLPRQKFRDEQISARQVPRRLVDAAWEIFTPAKLNLYLEVLGRRPDGFHALETLMVPVRVYDQLVWRPASGGENGVTLKVRELNGFASDSLTAGPLSAGPDNLVLRAARLLAESARIDPNGQFELFKRIPTQAGMGGGSSDAAAALLLANMAWGTNLERDQLMQLASQLGSDVPFFLAEGPAVCRGRGEIVEPVRGLPKLHFVVVKPQAGLSTAQVFSNVALANGERPCSTAAESHSSKLVSALRCGALGKVAQLSTNRLEEAALSLAPWLVKLRQAFAETSCLAHFLTGSGSAYVALVRTAKEARTIARQLAGRNLGSVFATSSC